MVDCVGVSGCQVEGRWGRQCAASVSKGHGSSQVHSMHICYIEDAVHQYSLPSSKSKGAPAAALLQAPCCAPSSRLPPKPPKSLQPKP